MEGPQTERCLLVHRVPELLYGSMILSCDFIQIAHGMHLSDMRNNCNLFMPPYVAFRLRIHIISAYMVYCTYVVDHTEEFEAAPDCFFTRLYEALQLC